MKIAVASGKGGTGKTTVSVNLFHFIKKYWENNVHLIDCDVEEPNDIIFFKDLKLINKKDVFQLVPEIDNEACTYCKKCESWCEFNAITIIPNKKFSEVNNTLCHSCGACSMACNFGAIIEKEIPLGVITEYRTNDNTIITEGCLEVGSPMQTILIKKLKKSAVNCDSLTLLDAPPGTSCPVVETVSDVDFVILVTEPTPFGLNDLKITIEFLEEIKKPFGVIVNKAGLGSDEVYKFIEEKNIELLGEIPFSKDYAGKYSSGDILQNISKDTEIVYKKIIEKIRITIANQLNTH